MRIDINQIAKRFGDFTALEHVRSRSRRAR